MNSIEEILSALKMKKITPAEANLHLMKVQERLNSSNDSRGPSTAVAESIVPRSEFAELSPIEVALTGSLASALYIDSSEVAQDTPFSELGLDSIVAVEWVRSINRAFGLSVQVVQLYDHPTIRQLAVFLQQEIGALSMKKPAFPVEVGSGNAPPLTQSTDAKPAVRDISQDESCNVKPEGTAVHRTQTDERKDAESVPLRNVVIEVPCLRNAPIQHPAVREEVESAYATTDVVRATPVSKGTAEDGAAMSPNPRAYPPIAVIGRAGKFPKSPDVAAYWQNLAEGRDCISEIPDDRWRLADFYTTDANQPGKTNNKWMGLLDDVDRFDPLFFNVSPAEAVRMDPQQRQFLQTCWTCLEDAAIDPSTLSGTRCGVFVGCGLSDYSEVLEFQELLAHTMLGQVPSILAARISYFLNLKGPCLAIDTACSSSLVAIAQACDSLTLGTSDLALAGGVCVWVGPSPHIMTSKAGMLSKTGKCYTFDGRADGFVPGEGVGAVLLKRLDDAERDGDQIFGVIRGWGVNQDGKTNGITAPSAASQAQLELDVYKRFRIDPSTISLVEAHGTGTKLGDPIEVEALVQSFGAYTKRAQFCALGSAKSNIGHLMSAAGVAGFVKVLLAFQHKMLPPTIHFTELNEHVPIKADGPFYVNTQLRGWDSDGSPRRAAVSSFGFSGTNAHVVLDEYDNTALHRFSSATDGQAHPIFVLSARTPELLRRYAERLKRFAETDDAAGIADILYTLQVGRRAFDHRLAFVARTREDLLSRLTEFAAQKSNGRIYIGQVKHGNEGVAVLGSDDDVNDLLHNWIAKGKFEKIAALWAGGLDIAWTSFYRSNRPRRISLPAYPFSDERYWQPKWMRNLPARQHEGSSSVLHPLLHRNTSTLSEHRYTTILRGDEHVLNDHRVDGHRILPGVAYMEMAREAIANTMEVPRGSLGNLQIKDLMWIRPLTYQGQELKVHIVLRSSKKGEIDFQIYSDLIALESGYDQVQKMKRLIHSQGRAHMREIEPSVATLDLIHLKNVCGGKVFSAQECYESLSAKGFDYGPSFRAIHLVHTGLDERGFPQALAKLNLSDGHLGTFQGYVLNPGILDAALQSAVTLSIMSEVSTQPGSLQLPYALQSCEVFRNCPPEAWAWLRCSEDSTMDGRATKIDVDICDTEGQVHVSLRGLTMGTARESKAVSDVFLARSVRESEPVLIPTPLQTEPRNLRHTVILCGQRWQITKNDGFQQQLKTLLRPGTEVIAVNGAESLSEADSYALHTRTLLATLQNVLRDTPKSNVLVQCVTTANEGDRLLDGLAGMLRTAKLESTHLTAQLIAVEPSVGPDELKTVLLEEAKDRNNIVIYRRNGNREVMRWRPISVSDNAGGTLWKDDGVYLITGGAGGLGTIFAREIASATNGVNLVLTGRSQRNPHIDHLLQALGELGAVVEYHTTDVADSAQVDNLISDVLLRHSRINGIIHCAGVLNDSYLVHKTADELNAVLPAKVHGVLNLDNASRNLDLDIFALFSSTSAIFGNLGQADYASANAFMDSFAWRRADLVKNGARTGITFSINWPLWSEGGMSVSAEVERWMQEGFGLEVLSTENGIRAFYSCWCSGHPQVLVLQGNAESLARKLDSGRLERAVTEAPVEANAVTDPLLAQRIQAYLSDVVSTLLKIPENDLEGDVQLDEYGLDSITFMDFCNTLNKDLSLDLVPTIFFQHSTLSSLAVYLVDEHQARLLSKFPVASSSGAIAQVASSDTTSVRDATSDRSTDAFVASTPAISHADPPTRLPELIALIGMAGRFPMSPDIDSFWRNLREGRDAITEVPAQRWDHAKYFHPDKGIPGSTYCKWGGFIEIPNLSESPAFQNTVRELSSMDIPTRLFFDVVRSALQDGGYDDSARLSSKLQIGMFLGAMQQPSSIFSTGAVSNSVSGNLDFRGPAMAVNTMSSSAMTALHLACMALAKGDCAMAIVGGLHLLDPESYLQMSRYKLIGSRIDSRSFAEGDGFLPSECAAAVLLKPLSSAIRDGDSIHAVIRSTAISCAGSLTIQNVPQAQARLIEQNLVKSATKADSISYVESAANGSPLGDAAELHALTRVFQSRAALDYSCPIGSVESNIGHAIAASGIAQLAKVVLQLQNGQIVPSIGVDHVNASLFPEGSPFYLQRELASWNRPCFTNGSRHEYPRRAMLNSFGAGGSYANVIIEEYRPNTYGKEQLC